MTHGEIEKCLGVVFSCPLSKRSMVVYKVYYGVKQYK